MGVGRGGSVWAETGWSVLLVYFLLQRHAPGACVITIIDKLQCLMELVESCILCLEGKPLATLMGLDL